MKKLILLVFLLIVANGICIGSAPIDIKNAVEIIEKETNTYSGENIPLEERVKNAEVYVFGISKKGDLNKRILALSDVLGLSGLINNKELSIKEEPKYEIENDTKANYPAVDKMEREIFGTTYEKENIYKRLDRLEKKEFGKTYSSSLSERVSNLQDKLNNKISSDSYSYLKKENKEYSDYNYYSPKSYNEDLAKIEKKFFKKSYENEILPSRLTRIETKLFSQSFENEDEQTRLERIDAVKKAAKSGTEYKINRFAKYAAAGVQIGGILLLILAMIL